MAAIARHYSQMEDDHIAYRAEIRSLKRTLSDEEVCEVVHNFLMERPHVEGTPTPLF